MKKTRVYQTEKPLTTIIPELNIWIQEQLQFPEPEESRCGNSVVLKSRLTGVIRQLAGLVFELKITLSQTGDGFVAEVDNGDVRKQLVALGISWFLFWPLLVTAGYGYFANNTVVDQVLNKLSELSAEETALIAG